MQVCSKAGALGQPAIDSRMAWCSRLLCHCLRAAGSHPQTLLNYTGSRRFVWFDRTTPESNQYLNWGTYVEGNLAYQEPNNRPAPQDCGVGNLSQAIGGLYGWADADCSMQLPFLCEINGTPGCISSRPLVP